MGKRTRPAPGTVIIRFYSNHSRPSLTVAWTRVTAGGRERIGELAKLFFSEWNSRRCGVKEIEKSGKISRILA